MVPPTPSAALHTDATDLGCSGTFNHHDLHPGGNGFCSAQVIWSWKDRFESISYRKLKAILLLLLGNFGRGTVKEEHRNLLLHIDNPAVVHIKNSFVSASRPMIKELWKLRLVLDTFGIWLRSEWIPSAANWFADGL